MPNVAINFGTSEQTDLTLVTMRELRAYEAEGHFPPGSMGPKVSAALRFLEGGGERVIIAHLNDAGAAVRGERSGDAYRGRRWLIMPSR